MAHTSQLSGFPDTIQVVLGPIWDGTNGLTENDVLTLEKVSGQDIWTEDGTLTADLATNRVQFVPSGRHTPDTTTTTSYTYTLYRYATFYIASTGTSGGWAICGSVSGQFTRQGDTRYLFASLWSNWTAASYNNLSESIGWYTGYSDYNSDVFKSMQAAQKVASLPDPQGVEWTEPSVTGSQSGGCWPVALEWTMPNVAPAGLKATVPSPQPVDWTLPDVTPQKSAGVSPIAVEWTEPSVTGSQPAGEPPAVIDWTLPDVAPQKSTLCEPLAVAWSIGDVTGELGSLVPRSELIRRRRGGLAGRRRSRSRLRRVARFAEMMPPGGLTRFSLTGRGKYRIFNAALYRFYRKQNSPPLETDGPFYTSASLDVTPPQSFGTGNWFLSVSYFNGVYDSGFLPLGPRGETYLQLVIESGQQVGNPPPGPRDWRLVPAAAGAVRMLGRGFDGSNTAPGQWAIAYTTNGSTPPEDSPTVTVAANGGSLKVLDYTLPTTSHGTTVKVRLQSRRNDGTVYVPSWVYSDGSEVKQVTSDAEGPTTPLHLAGWPGVGVRP